jgi:hypothetical protein
MCINRRAGAKFSKMADLDEASQLAAFRSVKRAKDMFVSEHDKLNPSNERRWPPRYFYTPMTLIVVASVVACQSSDLGSSQNMLLSNTFLHQQPCERSPNPSR